MKISYFGTKSRTEQRFSRVISGDYLRSELSDTGVDFRKRQLQMNGKSLEVQVWDVLVSQMTKPIRKRFYLGTKAVVLQMDSREMVDSLDEMVREIRQTSPTTKIAAVIDVSDPWAKENKELIKRLLYGKGVTEILESEGNTDEFQRFLERLSS